MSASSLSNSGWPRPTGTPRATTSMRAPHESPALAQLVHAGFQRRHDLGVRREERVERDLRLVDERDRDVAQLAHPADEGGAAMRLEPLARHGAGGDHRRGQPGRRAPAAARIAHAVLAPVGVVGVARAEGVEDVPVVLAALVGVADQQRDRGAGGDAFVDAGQDLDRVRLVALRHVARGAGPAPVELDCWMSASHRAQAGRAAVDHAADRRAVRFAEIGHAKEFAEGAS